MTVTFSRSNGCGQPPRLACCIQLWRFGPYFYGHADFGYAGHENPTAQQEAYCEARHRLLTALFWWRWLIARVRSILARYARYWLAELRQFAVAFVATSPRQRRSILEFPTILEKVA